METGLQWWRKQNTYYINPTLVGVLCSQWLVGLHTYTYRPTISICLQIMQVCCSSCVFTSNDNNENFTLIQSLPLVDINFLIRFWSTHVRFVTNDLCTQASLGHPHRNQNSNIFTAGTLFAFPRSFLFSFLWRECNSNLLSAAAGPFARITLQVVYHQVDLGLRVGTHTSCKLGRQAGLASWCIWKMLPWFSHASCCRWW